MSRACSVCGSVAAADAVACPVCGEPLGEPVQSGSATEDSSVIAPNTSAAEASAAQPTAESASPSSGESEGDLTQAGTRDAADTGTRLPPPPNTAFRDYLLTALGALALAAVIFVISQPKEVKGPPDPRFDAAATRPAMPPSHPPVDTTAPALTPQQQQVITALEHRVADNPRDLDSKLELANAYYDLQRHDEAVPLYRAYVAAHPENLSARTDMAFSIANTGRFDDAIAELKKILHDDPRQQIAAFNLARTYFFKYQQDSTSAMSGAETPETRRSRHDTVVYWLKLAIAIDSTTQIGQTAASILHAAEKQQP